MTATRLEVAERVRVVIGVFKGRIGIVTRTRSRAKSFSSYSVNVRFPDSDVDVAFRPDELETI